jgi:hypothetical protein
VSFVERAIDLVIQLAGNTQTNQPTTFVESGSDTVRVSGLRTSVQVANSGAPVGSTASVRVWGLTPSLMNQLATLGMALNIVPKNQLTILAGDKGATLSTIFTGTVWAAYGDYASMPDTPMHFDRGRTCSRPHRRGSRMADPTAQAGSTGAGQQYPSDSASDYASVAFLVRQILADLDIAKPVQVTAVNPGSGSPPAAGTVDVQLLVSLLDGSGNAQQQGVVSARPYFRLQGGPWAVIAEPAVGDIGLLVCCDRDVSSFVAAASAGRSPLVQPGSARQSSVSDGFYFGGFLSTAPQASVYLRTDGTFKITDKEGNVVESSSSGLTITPKSGQKVSVAGDLAVTGKITATDEITAKFGGAFVTLTQHVHSANNTPPTPGH